MVEGDDFLWQVYNFIPIFLSGFSEGNLMKHLKIVKINVGMVEGHDS